VLATSPMGPSATQTVHLRGRDGRVLLHARGMGLWPRYRGVSDRSLKVNGWTVDGAMAFQIFVSAVAAWAWGAHQRNAQLVAARNEINRLALAAPRISSAGDLHESSATSSPGWRSKADTGRAAGPPGSEAGRDRDRGVERMPARRGRRRAAAAGTGAITLAWGSGQRRTAAGGRHRGGTPRSGHGGQIPAAQQERSAGPCARAGHVLRHSGAEPAAGSGSAPAGRDPRTELRGRPSPPASRGRGRPGGDGQTAAEADAPAAGSGRPAPPATADAGPPAGTACSGLRERATTRGRQ